MKKTYLALILLFVFGLCTSSYSATTLKSDTNIKLNFYGNYDNTDIAIKIMVEKYLKKILKRNKLSGDGDTVTFDFDIKYIKWQDIPPRQIKEIRDIDSFTIDTKTDNRILITAFTAIGANYAVSVFLEEFLDIYWLFPGELGECIPDIDSAAGITIKSDVVTRKPVVLSRVYTGLEYRSPLYLKKLPYKGEVHTGRFYFKAYDYQKFLKLHHVFNSSHNMINIFNREEHFGKVDEIFPIIKGKRYFPPEKPKKGAHAGSGRWQGWHPCYSSDKAVEIATEKANAFFRAKRGLVFSLGINDGANMWCHCEKCEAAGWVQAYYDFVNKVARNVKKEYPSFLIGVLAYGGVGLPPERLKLEDNVLVNSTGHLKNWIGIGKNLSKYEYFYGWGFWVPSNPLEAVKQRGKMYKDNGVIGLHAEVHPLWAFDGPKVNIFSKILWDEKLDIDAELKKYCEKGYGGAAQEIYDFYMLWVDYSKRFHTPPEGHGLSPELGWYFRRSTKQLSAVPHDVKIKARNLLNAAEKKVSTAKEKARFEMLNTFYRYTEVLFEQIELRKKAFTYKGNVNYFDMGKEIYKRIDERKGILNKMREKKEWFAGTRQNVKTILGGTWEGRWEWTIDYEIESAIKTSLYNAYEKSGAQNTGLKVKHGYSKYFQKSNLSRNDFKILMKPWVKYYHMDGHVPAEVAEDKNTGIVEFKMSGSKSVKVDENAQYKWLATEQGFKKVYFRGNAPLEQGESYFFEMNLKASGGVVDIKIENENDCGKMVYLKYPFKKGVEEKKLRFVMDPVKCWGGNKPVANWSVVVMFLPEKEDTVFSGNCKISKIDYAEGK
ncbi:MAG: DUF4838 domain-containing protein [Planctomycetota bacterium]